MVKGTPSPSGSGSGSGGAKLKRGRGSSSKKSRPSVSPQDQKSQAFVPAYESATLPDSPKSSKRCAAFFSFYGCSLGERCQLSHFAPSINKDAPVHYGDVDENLRVTRVPPSRRQDVKGFSTSFGPPANWKGTVTLLKEVKRDWINKASELSMRQIGKANSVNVEVKDHPTMSDFKCVEITGNLDQANRACRSILEFESRSLHRMAQLAPATVIPETESGSCGKKGLGQNVFRMLLPTAFAASVPVEEFKANTHASLEIIKGSIESIALVYAEEQPDGPCPAAEGILWLFDFVTKRFTDTCAKLLIGREQAYGFFETLAESVEKECRCTFAVHDAGDVGLRQDFILEVVGKKPRGLRSALKHTVSHLESFVVHSSVIPMLEMLMNKDCSQESSSIEVCPPASSYAQWISNEGVVEYHLELYYIAMALIGDRKETLAKIRQETGVRVTLEESNGHAGKMMVRIVGSHREVFDANQLVKKLLSEANEILDIGQASYWDS